jgi:hypothetical protein
LYSCPCGAVDLEGAKNSLPQYGLFPAVCPVRIDPLALRELYHSVW